MSLFSDKWKEDQTLIKDFDPIIFHLTNLNKPFPLSKTEICNGNHIEFELPTLIDKRYYVIKQFAIDCGTLKNETIIFSFNQIDELAFLSSAFGDKLYYNNSPLKYPLLRHHLVINHRVYTIADELKKLFDKYGNSPSVFYAEPVAQCREIVNNFRKKHQQKIDEIFNGCVNRGEVDIRWKSEYELFVLVKSLFPDAVFQYSPQWLNKQSLDIYIASINTAIEYQGLQHYQAVDYFGGEENFIENVKRDKKKRKVCLSKGVKLYYWKYDVPITKENLLLLLEKEPFIS